MGPGRWGSRGDIRLGVRVTYSDINNSAMLIEIARKVGNYVPDLSFGTHFFQDLVEARHPLPGPLSGRGGRHLRRDFFQESPNTLPDLLPEYEHLSNVLRVIDVPAATRRDASCASSWTPRASWDWASSPIRRPADLTRPAASARFRAFAG